MNIDRAPSGNIKDILRNDLSVCRDDEKVSVLGGQSQCDAFFAKPLWSDDGDFVFGCVLLNWRWSKNKLATLWLVTDVTKRELYSGGSTENQRSTVRRASTRMRA